MDEVFLKLMSFLSSIEGASMTIAIILEFVFRIIPSKKPLSILYVVASGARMSGEFLLKLAAIADKVLPQKTKE